MSAQPEKRDVTYGLLLAAVALAFYNPLVRNSFVDFDDRAYILKNWHVQGGLTWETVKWAFTTFYQGNWHPLTWLSHALDYKVFHLNPVGHHYTSLLLHTASAIVLFLLLRRATGFVWSSLAVAALFALHPINVESIAWAAERKNVLSMLFFLLTLHAYDRYARQGVKKFYWLVIAFFALGLMAKPQIVTLPFVLLLWDYWPLRRMAGDSSSVEGTGEKVFPTSTPRSFLFLLAEKLPLFYPGRG
jgi:protein O-mannosyl-transferase